MQAELILQNPQAAMPLRVPISVECNTPQERVLANVLTNSRRAKTWIKSEPAHDKVGVLVGGGPSLADTLDDILFMQEKGAKVFALNAAACFLWAKGGIYPDYQVIMDAQPKTSGLIGPADTHLFASQVDPSLFEIEPCAHLWHATYGNLCVDEQEGFPEHDDGYCLIGGAISVGNTALVLMYAMGYREIHVFGMDSCHRAGAAHAYRQDMNLGDLCTTVNFQGVDYTCSVTMSLQARHFMQRKAQLEAGGCKIKVYGSGLLPAIANAAYDDMSEEDKYRLMWSIGWYRNFSPGEDRVADFLEIVKPDSAVIDFGCGTGRAGLKMAAAGLQVMLVDFADNCRDEEARRLPFTKADLTKPIPLHALYGYCTDVMEHIPPRDVEAVVRNIMGAAKTVFFQISTVKDDFGALIGQSLHLTVQPHDWWRDLFARLGYVVNWQEQQAVCSCFLVERK